MASEQSRERHRFCLPPGTRVEDWRVEHCHGHGAYGIVYRAVRMGHEAQGPVALKLALYPWDPRFMREVGLLSLIHHPSVPRLYGQGFWKHPTGTVFPFIVMEWVEGTPLYAWAREHAPNSVRVLRGLAQLTRALQATHEAGAVHRDVKGENVLVRSADGRAMLVDFGAGNYQAAARLTWQPMPPGTPAYQSPESGLFQLRSVRSPGAHYLAGPADDVFSLGVTAYRLVTGEYPPSPEPQMDEQGAWHMAQTHLPAPRELNPQVAPELSALILRMLAVAPEARGSAAELAEALEAAAARMEPETEPPALEVAQGVAEAVPPKAEEPMAVPVLAEQRRPRARSPAWKPRLLLAGVGVSLALWAVHVWHGRLEAEVSKDPLVAERGRAEERPADLGDTVPAAPLASVQQPSKQEVIAQVPPPKPRPGQLRPNARGQCPGRKQVPINGGCWVEQFATDAEECEQNGYVLIRERCYAPALEARREPPPTSEQPQ